MNTLLQLVLIATIFVQSVISVQAPLVISDGTPVRIRINQTISSADGKVGQTVDFEILDDVNLGRGFAHILRRGC